MDVCGQCGGDHAGPAAVRGGGRTSSLRRIADRTPRARAGALAGEWRRAFAERGVTLAQADCLVAAAAVGVGATLATGNPKDFPMEELDVEVWAPGA